jgi:hypothetical protein
MCLGSNAGSYTQLFLPLNERIATSHNNSKDFEMLGTPNPLPRRSSVLRILHSTYAALTDVIQKRTALSEHIQAFRRDNEPRFESVSVRIPILDALEHLQYQLRILAMYHNAGYVGNDYDFDEPPNEEFTMEHFLSEFENEASVSTVTVTWRLKNAICCFADKVERILPEISAKQKKDIECLRWDVQAMDEVSWPILIGTCGGRYAAFGTCFRSCWEDFEAAQHIRVEAYEDD